MTNRHLQARRRVQFTHLSRADEETPSKAAAQTPQLSTEAESRHRRARTERDPSNTSIGD